MPLDQQELLDQRVPLEQREPRVPLVPLEQLDLQDQPESLDLQERLVLREIRVQPVQPVLQV